MATKKSVTRVEADEAPSYGKKSEPPRKAVKDMMSKQSESSSKDALHGGKAKSQASDASPIILHLNQKGPLKFQDIIDGQMVFGSVGAGKTKPEKKKRL
jgi:hypothetical protein